MKVASLHSPLLRRAIETINEGRLEDFLALFARDATVVDGETYQGSEAIRAWAERETFGIQMHIDVVQDRRGDSSCKRLRCRRFPPGKAFTLLSAPLLRR